MKTNDVIVMVNRVFGVCSEMNNRARHTLTGFVHKEPEF